MNENKENNNVNTNQNIENNNINQEAYPQQVQPNINNNVQEQTQVQNTNQSIDEDYSLKKPDFVIKSKKDTVAEEVEARNKKIQDKIDQANANYKPNSKFKNFLLIFLFVFMFLFILFLPEIRTFLVNLQNENKTEDKITNGYLECTLEKSNDKFDLNYTYIFKFSDNKLYYLTGTSSTKGDSINDEEELKEIENKCNNLDKQVEGLDGISITCSNTSGKVTKTEKFDYSKLDKEKLSSVYTEAGGTYPEYNLDDDMDKIESNMKSSGFTCKRVSN